MGLDIVVAAGRFWAWSGVIYRETPAVWHGVAGLSLGLEPIVKTGLRRATKIPSVFFQVCLRPEITEVP
jgi:hypothetical protein